MYGQCKDRFFQSRTIQLHGGQKSGDATILLSITLRNADQLQKNFSPTNTVN